MNSIKSTKDVQKIIDSKDNIIDQLKALRKYRHKKGVRQYIDRLISTNQIRDYDDDSKYILYCIVKYYYGLDVEEVNPPNELELLRLYAYYPEVKAVDVPIMEQAIDKIKVGDKITILSGSFKGLEAFVQSIDLKNEKLGVIVNLFGQVIKADITYKEVEVVRRERKSRSTR